MTPRLRPWLVPLLLGLPLAAAADEDAFALREIASPGRTVAVELLDVDGNGRADLVQFLYSGLPPDERREIRVFLQDESRRIAAQPDFVVAVPAGSASYDVGDLLPDPGAEIVLLRPGGLTLLSLASPQARRVEIEVPGGGTTLAASEDERGMDRTTIVYREFAAEPWLLIPMLGQVVLFGADAGLRARLEVGGRSNYFMRPSPGPLVADADVQLFFDAPRISVGDVDGDGSTDVVASGRHEVRVFLRRPDGSFARKPDRELALRRVSERDHIRGSGTVATGARDIDADGRLDLILSQVSGGLADASMKTQVFLNRAGSWKLDAPDYEFQSEQGWGADQLIDLDGDGRLELLHIGISMSVLELVEVLVTQAIDVHVKVFRNEGAVPYGPKPWFERKLDVPFSFETTRPRGFVPNPNYDFNGDGKKDLLLSGSGDRLDVFLGGGDPPYRTRIARQKLDSAGRLGSGDFDGDGLADFLIYDPRRPKAAVLLGVNLGTLPGTLPRVGAGGASLPEDDQ